jgi:hypothetical protein
MNEKFYGWIKNVREMAVQRNFMAVKIPDIIDLTAYAPHVINQLQVGRCTGCGIGGTLAATMNQLGLNPTNDFVFSPDGIYNGERVLEGTLSQDCGGQPVDGYRWISAHGVLPYAVMPLTASLNTTNPLVDAGQAVMLPNFQPVGIDTTPETVIDNLLDALASNHLVAQGAAFFAAWESYTGGVLPLQDAHQPVGGGHETYYLYADSVRRIFKLRNSWGTGWGESGDYEMSFDQLPILAGMGMDLHYSSFSAPVTPVPPTPVPQKRCCLTLAILHEMRYNKVNGNRRVNEYENCCA